MRTLRDLNYDTDEAAEREWFAEMHPRDLWQIMTEMYVAYLNRYRIPMHDMDVPL
jgi:hypothetical protein